MKTPNSVRVWFAYFPFKVMSVSKSLSSCAPISWKPEAIKVAAKRTIYFLTKTRENCSSSLENKLTTGTRVDHQLLVMMLHYNYSVVIIQSEIADSAEISSFRWLLVLNETLSKKGLRNIALST